MLLTFLPKPPAIVGEQAHGTDASGNITGSSGISALGGPSVWSWEEDHGRPCGLSKWHCFLGLTVGGLGRWVFFKPDGGGFGEMLGCVCFFFKGRGRLKLRFLQVVSLGGREGRR